MPHDSRCFAGSDLVRLIMLLRKRDEVKMQYVELLDGVGRSRVEYVSCPR